VPLKARDVKASLTKKFGFAPLAQGKDHDHEWLAVTLPDAGRVAVMFSRNDAELRDVLLGRICRQLRVLRPYLNGMIECSNTREAYYRKIADESPAVG
jgi:hypothetical protein